MFSSIFIFFTFSVGKAPQFTRRLKNTEVTLPGEVKLFVDVDLGKPDGEVKWFKDWKELYPGGKFAMSLNKRRAELLFKDAQLTDSGKYRCLVKNAVGEDECEATLTLACKIFSNTILIYITYHTVL